MLDNSQIIGITDSESKHQELKLLDGTTRRQVSSISINQRIIRTILTSSHIGVVDAHHVHLYTHSVKAITHAASYDTADNPFGICALGRSRCVFPARSAGQIQIIEFHRDTDSPESISISSHKIVPAHNGALRALCLTRDEEIVCSASTTVSRSS